MCHTAHLRWHGLLCQVVGGIWGAGCCCHVEEQTCLAFQGKGQNFCWALLGPPLVGRPDSVSIFRRHLLKAVITFNCFLIFFPLIPYPWVSKGTGNLLCAAQQGLLCGGPPQVPRAGTGGVLCWQGGSEVRAASCACSSLGCFTS